MCQIYRWNINQYLRDTLQQSGGRRVEAAKLLGWERNTLTRKIEALELKV